MLRSFSNLLATAVAFQPDRIPKVRRFKSAPSNHERHCRNAVAFAFSSEVSLLLVLPAHGRRKQQFLGKTDGVACVMPCPQCLLILYADCKVRDYHPLLTSKPSEARKRDLGIIILSFFAAGRAAQLLPSPESRAEWRPVRKAGGIRRKAYMQSSGSGQESHCVGSTPGGRKKWQPR